MKHKKIISWKRMVCFVVAFALIFAQVPNEQAKASDVVTLVGGITKVPANITKGGADQASSKYSSAWQYWSQGASKYAAMYWGCRVTAYAKMLAEAGYTGFGNPDGFFEWGRGTYFRASDTLELVSFGSAPITYIKNQGGTASLGGKVSLSGNRASDCATIMNYINQGYYVILQCSAHTAYIGRDASQTYQTPIILDSWASSSVNPSCCQKYASYTEYSFQNLYYFSIKMAAPDNTKPEPDSETSDPSNEGGKQFANYAATFSTINGQTVSSTAEASKEATILIFGMTKTCSYSALTVRSLAQSNWAHSNKVKIIYVDIKGADAATVTSFAKEYGSRKMIFCYDPDGVNGNLAVKYMRSSGKLNGSFVTPAIVLIDAEDQVRCIYNGYYSAGDIYNTIRKFANISPNDPEGEDPASGWGNEDGDDTSEKEQVERTLSLSGKEDYDAAYQVLQIVNQTRAAVGASPLQMDESLLETAMQRAAEISLYYSHTRPNGQSCFTIFKRKGSLGENIAVGYLSAQQVMEGWNGSPGHYANIIDEKFKSIGVGCFVDSNGTCHWVQCFDGVTAVDPNKKGIVDVQYMLPILESFISLNTQGVSEIGCGSSQSELYMDIHNANVNWIGSRPELSSNNFDFTSSNPDIAAVGADGKITIKAAGTAVITASLKENPALKVSRAVTKKSHEYQDTVVAPTYTSQGYTRHTCSSCNDSYVDTYTPMLTKPSGNTETGPSDSQTPDSTKPESGTEKPSDSQTPDTQNPPNTEEPDTEKPVQVKKPSVSNVKLFQAKAGKKKLILSWKKLSGAAGYQIQVSTKKNFKGAKTISVSKSKKSYTAKGLKEKKKYYLRIRAYKTYKNAAGKTEKAYGAWTVINQKTK